MQSYTDPVIEKCRYLSENINAYFDEKRYIAEVEQIEQVTPQFLRDLAISLLLDELSVIGIESSFVPSDLITSAIDMETAFYLRSKFDGTNFYKTLKALDEASYSEFSGINENITLAEDMLREFAEYFSEKFPLDVGWQYIARSMDHWTSTEAFVKHINAICIKLEHNTDPNKTSITESNLDEVSAFLNHMQAQAEELKTYFYYFVKNYSTSQYPIDFAKLRTLIKKYDHDKLHPDILPFFASYHKEQPEEEPSYVKHHHLTVNHHYEYWKLRNDREDNHEIMEWEEAIMYILALVLDRLTEDEITKEINTKLKALTNVVDEKVIYFLHELSHLDYEAIRTGAIADETK